VYLSFKKTSKTMSIQQLKSHICELVEDTEDEALLKAVNRILSMPEDADMAEDFTDEQVAAIKLAEEEVSRGNYVTLAEHKRKIEQWLINRK